MPRASLKHILALEHFRLEPQEQAELYPRAYALPAFFTHNLLSPRRVVKYFQGGQALVGAFYYQLMKLALELEPEAVNYRELVFGKFVQFELFGEGELEDDLFSDFQYRKFFKDFIEAVEKEDLPSFERTAQLYPIIDEILIKLFRIILPMPLLMELEECRGGTAEGREVARAVLSFLCAEFQITLSEIGPCFKLEESDTFIYFENVQEVFLAFNEIAAEPEEEQSSEFTSTFECGVGNSFLTKYHSQTLSKPNNTHTIPKPASRDSILLLDTKENIAKFPASASASEKFEQCNLTSGSNFTRGDKFTTESWGVAEKQGLAGEPSGPFQQLSSLLNRDLKKLHPTLGKPARALYGEFTDSLILKEMPTLYRDGIRSIKDKYKRGSIRNFL